MILNVTKTQQKGENYRPISLVKHRFKISHQNISKLNSGTTSTMIKAVSSQRCWDISTCIIIKGDPTQKTNSDRNHMNIYLIRCRKGLEQNPTIPHDESPGECQNTGHIPQFNKGTVPQSYR